MFYHQRFIVVARHTSVTSIDGSSTDCSSFSEYPQKSDTERAHQSISALKEKGIVKQVLDVASFIRIHNYIFLHAAGWACSENNAPTY